MSGLKDQDARLLYRPRSRSNSLTRMSVDASKLEHSSDVNSGLDDGLDLDIINLSLDGASESISSSRRVMAPRRGSLEPINTPPCGKGALRREHSLSDVSQVGGSPTRIKLSPITVINGKIKTMVHEDWPIPSQSPHALKASASYSSSYSLLECVSPRRKGKALPGIRRTSSVDLPWDKQKPRRTSSEDIPRDKEQPRWGTLSGIHGRVAMDTVDIFECSLSPRVLQSPLPSHKLSHLPPLERPLPAMNMPMAKDICSPTALESSARWSRGERRQGRRSREAEHFIFPPNASDTGSSWEFEN